MLNTQTKACYNIFAECHKTIDYPYLPWNGCVPPAIVGGWGDTEDDSEDEVDGMESESDIGDGEVCCC